MINLENKMTKRYKELDKAQKALTRALKVDSTPKAKAEKIRKLIKENGINGLVIWRGKSEIDNKTDIVTIAQISPGGNEKIGRMTQLYYLVDTKTSPVEIAKTGQDFAICGKCKHRPVNLGSCYVTLFQGVRAIHKAYHDDSYFDLSKVDFKIVLELLSLIDMPIRFGAYGDPASMPYDKQYQIAKKMKFELTGYTHQWNDFGNKFSDFKNFLHASVDNDKETETAKEMDWKYYKIALCGGVATADKKSAISRNKNLSDEKKDELIELQTKKVKTALKLIKQPNEILCLNTNSDGIVDCASCLKCSGNSKNGHSIVNALHGARVKTYQKEAAKKEAVKIHIVEDEELSTCFSTS